MKKDEVKKDEIVKTVELSIVDHILAGDMEKAKEAIQNEVVKVVSGEISKPQ